LAQTESRKAKKTGKHKTMEKPRILIVEDELIIAQEIKRALIRLAYEPLEPIDNSEEVLAMLAHASVDLILMDINIKGDTDGIATAILLQSKYKIPLIFLTALSDDHTLQRAKIASPAGYIVKPFEDHDLKTNIEIALYKHQQTPETTTTNPKPLLEVNIEKPKAFFVKKGNKYVKLAMNDIMWIEALDNYICLHTPQDQYVVYSTMKEIEQKLPAHFFKAHRSYIVNLDKIEAFEDSYVMIGNKALPVSRSSREELKKRILFL
jgi:DNA-binding LytR/AlgR family response regulator